MYATFLNLITINAKPQTSLTRNSFWHGHNFRNCSQKLNYIQLNRRKYCIFIYKKGCVKLTFNKLKYVSCIKNILRHIIANYVTKLFGGPIPKYFFKLSQVWLSFHPDFEPQEILSPVKIKSLYPTLEICVNNLKFKFCEANLQFSLEECPSHFIANISNSENKKIATLNIYTNYKVTTLINKSFYLQQIHNVIPLFVESLNPRWNSSAGPNL